MSTKKSDLLFGLSDQIFQPAVDSNEMVDLHEVFQLFLGETNRLD